MTSLPPLNALDVAARLVACRSVTPAAAGAWDVLHPILTDLGFSTEILAFGDGDGDGRGDGDSAVENMFAKYGNAGKTFSFCGHIDVVPAGDETAWSYPPFAAMIDQGRLFGRGAVDMKGGVACFIAAAARFIKQQPHFKGGISLMLTADEEGPAVHGIAKLMPFLAARGDTPSVCLVGEPTSTRQLGDMMKIGRRGSLTGLLTVTGIQGHIAYPDRADNPIPKLLRLLAALGSGALDDGTPHFPPSNLEIFSIDCGNKTTNLIPAKITAGFNLRFNNTRRGAEWEQFIRARLDAVGIPYDLNCVIGGEAFVTEPGAFSALIAAAVAEVTGRSPEASTTGGTSDARFIAPYCPVVEFGLVGESMHKIDESVRVVDLEALTEIYYRILARFFAGE